MFNRLALSVRRLIKDFDFVDEHTMITMCDSKIILIDTNNGDYLAEILFKNSCQNKIILTPNFNMRDMAFLPKIHEGTLEIVDLMK